jgi:hypothetical protein
MPVLLTDSQSDDTLHAEQYLLSRAHRNVGPDQVVGIRDCARCQGEAPHPLHASAHSPSDLGFLSSTISYARIVLEMPKHTAPCTRRPLA